MKRQAFALVSLTAACLVTWGPLNASADCSDPGPPPEHVEFYGSSQRAADICNNRRHRFEIDRVIQACTALLREGCSPHTGSRLYSHDERTFLMSVYAGRARAYSDANRIEEALADLDAALDLRPGEPRVMNQRCWIRAIHNRDLDLALADCNAALQQRPNDPNILDSRGLVHLQRGEFDAALADYDSALRSDPRSTDVLYGRGIARMRLGQVAESATDMEAATTRDPEVAERFRRYGVQP